MSASKQFRVGDFVECVADGYANLTRGSVYQVSGCTKPWEITVLDNYPRFWDYDIGCFKRVLVRIEDARSYPEPIDIIKEMYSAADQKDREILGAVLRKAFKVVPVTTIRFQPMGS